MDFQFFGAEKAAVVLDIGTKSIKCGFAGEPTPRRIFPTTFSSQNGKKLSLASFLSIHKECKEEWLEATENLLHDIYYLFLQCNPRERRVIICENLLSPTVLRECLTHVLLEKFQALAITFVYNPVVSLVPILKTTALVVDLGYSETRVIPVYSGVALTGAMTSSQKCVKSILQHLASQISTPVSENVLEDILVRLCFMKPENSLISANDVIYPINSTTKIAIPGSVRSNAASILLTATENDDDDDNRDVPSLILQALKKSAGTTRKGLSHTILFMGGGAHHPGLAKAIITELNSRLAANKTNPNYEFSELTGLQNHFDILTYDQLCPPSYLAWVGGSVAGTLDQYGQKITKDTYLRESKMIPDWLNLKTLSLTS